MHALADGRVSVERCGVNYLTMPVEQCFERAFSHGEVDVAAIGLMRVRRHVLPWYRET